MKADLNIGTEKKKNSFFNFSAYKKIAYLMANINFPTTVFGKGADIDARVRKGFISNVTWRNRLPNRYV